MNPRDFVTAVRKQELEDDDVMASFDVVSLFTTVPIGLAVDVVEKRLLDDCTLGSRTALLVEDIVILLRFCLNQTYLLLTTCCTIRLKVVRWEARCPLRWPIW